jgi:putative transposase
VKYHFVWCPKYRRNILTGEIAGELRSLLYPKGQELNAMIEALESMPDHVRLFVQSDPTEAPQRLANQFKGYTSRLLRQRFPQLRSRLPGMWSGSYQVGTLGHVPEESIRRSIEAQKSS